MNASSDKQRPAAIDQQADDAGEVEHLLEHSPRETAMFRMRTIFGDELNNRSLSNQKTEARLRCKMLNRLTKIEMPAFNRVSSTRPFAIRKVNRGVV